MTDGPRSGVEPSPVARLMTRPAGPVSLDRIGPVGSAEVQMAQFMDVHSGFFGVSRQQLAEAHARDLAIQEEEGVRFERAWLDPERGKAFCLAIGPTREAVMRVHERAGHPTAEVYELQVEV